MNEGIIVLLLLSLGGVAIYLTRNWYPSYTDEMWEEYREHLKNEK
jgi:hypothetical protein